MVTKTRFKDIWIVQSFSWNIVVDENILALLKKVCSVGVFFEDSSFAPPGSFFGAQVDLVKVDQGGPTKVDPGGPTQGGPNWPVWTKIREQGAGVIYWHSLLLYCYYTASVQQVAKQ